MAVYIRRIVQWIITVWETSTFIVRLQYGVIIVETGVDIGLLLFRSDTDIAAYCINLYTSLLSVVATVFIIDLLNRRRDEQRTIKDLQEQLVRDASSKVNDVANNAVHQLRKRGWLKGENGLLKGALLMGANLKGADLDGANLKGADLVLARLNGASLGMVHLEGALLACAHLEGALLAGTHLEGALLLGAHLEGALVNRHMLTEMDEETKLPDGSKWTPETDLTKFGVIIDPNLHMIIDPHHD